MDEEKQFNDVVNNINATTKKCNSCGIYKSFDAFRKDARSKDGHCKICDACKAKIKDGNPELSEFTPKELMDELRCRGYSGVLKYVEVHEISI